ncbi:MAG: hypothetical protein OWS74_07115, partial [Firmicutes bacterium]|nr:hypothetical protein [Bacillota bacterium]
MMELPTIDYDLFVNTYFGNVTDARLRLLMFNAYRNLVTGNPLSSLFSGTTYIRVRNALASVGFLTRSNDYAPFPSLIRSPRIFPNGDVYDFDIYLAQPYEEKGKKYTVQVHFNVWLPFGVFLRGNDADVLFRLFYRIADLLFSRINIGASIEDMAEAQNTPVTIGIQSHAITMLHNIDTVSIIISKIQYSTINSYIYD